MRVTATATLFSFDVDYETIEEFQRTVQKALSVIGAEITFHDITYKPVQTTDAVGPTTSKGATGRKRNLRLEAKHDQ